MTGSVKDFRRGRYFLREGSLASISNLSWKTFEHWRKRLGQLVIAALASSVFLGYQLSRAWSFAILPTVAIGFLFSLPVLGSLFLWWVWTELTSIPGLLNNMSKATDSFSSSLDASRNSDGVFVTDRTAPQVEGCSLIRRIIRFFFRGLGFYWNVSDVTGAIAMAMSLLNPISIVLIFISLMGSCLLVVFGFGYLVLG